MIQLPLATSITLADKIALGLPTCRCSCRTRKHWVPFYLFKAGQLRRVYLCTRCDEQAEVAVPQSPSFR